MSAFVAFNGFPGEDVQAPIQTLLVQERQTQVPVPAKPVHAGVLAAKRSAAPADTHRVAAKHASSPTASTGPVVHRTGPNATQPAPAPTAPSGSGGGGTATPVAQTTPLGSPSPTGTDPQLPPITLPSILPPPPPQPPPPGSSQLPIDTSSITGLLGGS